MVRRKIVIYSGFNRVMFPHVGYNSNGVHNVLTEDWIRKRYDIWVNHTWKSIKNQAYKDWVYCLCCNPDAKDITDRYFAGIKDKRFFLVYSDTDQELGIMRRLSKNTDEMINVRIDSDDMYHKFAIKELSMALNNSSDNWFLWRNGYAYQYIAPHGMKRYNANSGPFFACRYQTKKWLKQGSIKIVCQHRDVAKLHKPKILNDNMIMVGITNTNSSTLFKLKCFKSKVLDSEKTRILEGFGIV